MAYEIFSSHMHKKKMWIPLVNYYFITPYPKDKDDGDNNNNSYIINCNH